jgi:hypothetical protein
VTGGRYALGVAELLVILGSLGVGATGLRAWLVPDCRGALARLVDVVVGLALLVGVCEVLGTFGVFQSAPIVAGSIAVGGGVWWLARRQSDDPGPPTAPRVHTRQTGDVLAVVFAFVAGGCVVAKWVGPTLYAYDHGILGLDSLWYHMPWAAWYAESGQVAAIHLTDVQYLTAFYPASGELLHGLGIVVMGNDVLSPGLNLICLALILLAAWCIGNPYGVGPASVMGASIAMGVPTFINSQPGSADTDALGVFFLLAAVAIWLNSEGHGRTGRTLGSADAAPTSIRRIVSGPMLAAAGLAAGLAISVRLNLVPAILGLTSVVIALGARGQRRALTAWWVGAAVLTGSFWYVRDLVAVGNPFPWFGLGILPTPRPPLMEHTELTVWHYITNQAVWTHFFLPDFAHALGPWWAPILVIMLLGAVVCVALGPSARVRMVGLVTLAATLGYLLTPGSAATAKHQPIGFLFNLRYAAPALTLGLTTAPLSAPLRGRHTRWATLAALATVLGFTLVRDRPLMETYVAAAVITAIVFLIIGVGIVRRAGESTRQIAGWRRKLLAGGVLSLIAASCIAGYNGQRSYLQDRYADSTGLRSVSYIWRWARAIHDTRIALGGTLGAELQYPLWGADSSNDVEYVAARGPHGSFTPILTCRKWRAALNAGRFAYVLTSRDVNPVTRETEPALEYAWTTTDPGVRLLTRTPTRSWVQLFQIIRPLDPDTCPQ